MCSTVVVSANVSPLYKSGSRTNAENYRPVSLTSQICTLFELLIRDVLVSHLEFNQAIVDSQHGFRKGRSCSTNLSSFHSILSLWQPRLAQWHVHWSYARRPRLVLGWVTVREDQALWTCIRSSVWTLICADCLYSRHRDDTEVKWIKVILLRVTY